METVKKSRFTDSYMWTVVAFGGASVLFCIWHLPIHELDFRFLVLAIITWAVGSRITIKIPNAKGHISVSDTLIFLSLIFFGGETAVILATLDGLFSSLRFSKRILTISFNGAVLGFSTFITYAVLYLAFGSITRLTSASYSPTFLVAISLMGLVQYLTNSGMVALAGALKTSQPFWQTWRNSFLWTSITYFAGAAAAGIIAKCINVLGLYALLATAPIIVIIYITYRMYLKTVEISIAQAEQAERHAAELQYAAYHDGLTGLPNRVKFTELLRRAIEYHKAGGQQGFAVLFVDLDRFKNINDSLGHARGDELLITVARRLEHGLRPSDAAARFGGDEFAVLLHGIKDANDAIQVAERIKTELAQPFNLSGHEVFTTASIGIALSDTGYDNPDDVLRDADTAMYRAKANGKGRYEVFDVMMHARVMSLLQMESDMRRAIEREEFFLLYQPIVEMETGKLCGFEALIRWQHPERGFVSPADFIPLAEETGMILPIGQWVLKQACAQLHEWQMKYPQAANFVMSVNLSGKQFAQTDLVEQVKLHLAETNLKPWCLKLELTESIVMQHADAAGAMLNDLKALGVQISIDDFGTGYSSLSYLHTFPVDTLKVDRSFVMRMTEQGENAEIVRAIIMLAHSLGMDVVAEGVEYEYHQKHLIRLDCEYGQGYLFAKPVKSDVAETLIVKQFLSPAPEPLLSETPAIKSPANMVCMA